MCLFTCISVLIQLCPVKYMRVINLGHICCSRRRLYVLILHTCKHVCMLVSTHVCVYACSYCMHVCEYMQACMHAIG